MGKENIVKSENKFISVRGARLHNLKNVDVDIPRHKFTVITGVSGSGKSSLAFDTIYAEGQRRFVESLSSYARQFLERMHKPDADSVTGIPPAIAIEQNTLQRNPRSTVGTNTEIYDYLRILFGRVGETICYSCGEKVKRDSPESIVDDISKFDDGDKIFILFPIADTTETLKNSLDNYREKGFFRIVKKNSFELTDLETDDYDYRDKPEDIYILADRLIYRKDEENITRLTDSVELAFNNGSERVAIANLSMGKFFYFSGGYECSNCDIIYEEPDPKLFSFNNPHGACPKCQGFGRTIGIDEDMVIPDRSKSIRMNAIGPFKGETMSKYLRMLIRIAPDHGIDIDAPISELSDEQWKIIWDGTKGFPGINGFFAMLEEKSYKMHYRVMLSRYRGYTTCKACGGSRLRTSARQVFVSGKNIPELIKLPLERVYKWIDSIDLNDFQREVAGQVIREISWRLKLLLDIGLEYLTLSRLAHTLSGGESQRINLSTALGSSLVGTLYVLDEPSIGLHPRDTRRLLNILFKLKNLGNTVIVVEHDPDVIRFADYIVDMGPLAGEHGGEVVFRGIFDEMLEDDKSLTGKYFSRKKTINFNRKRRKGNGKKITVINPRENNLKINKVEFPLGCMTVVTGVSGSGKSTLVHDILYGGMKKMRGAYQGIAGKFDNITGDEYVEHIEMVDQTPIGRSSRSTPATYTKAFDSIRELFADTQASKQHGWKPGYFSFNVPGGRCEVCEGEGVVTVDMQFLPDVQLECESCKGTRYKREVRNILYNGKSIVDVLNLTIDEAVEFFSDVPKITRKLQNLREVGLGYLRLGQPSTNLSGGESQRIKLAGHLDSGASGDTLFIFDEPTTGLHMDDISKLLGCFDRLVDSGHTVVIIEHNLHIIASADRIIDLGPEAGDNGGEIVVEGTPEQIIKKGGNSHTGLALKEFFDREIT